MTDLAAIEQIIAQYAKHGWELRRVLCLAGRDLLTPSGSFDGAEIVQGELEALWFSRSSRPETTAWELRHLGKTPFALVTAIPQGAGPDDSANILKDTEIRMLEALQARAGKVI